MRRRRGRRRCSSWTRKRPASEQTLPAASQLGEVQPARRGPTLRAGYEREIAELEAKKAALIAQVKELQAAEHRAADQDAAALAAAEHRRLLAEGSEQQLQAFEARVTEEQRQREQRARRSAPRTRTTATAPT